LVVCWAQINYGQVCTGYISVPAISVNFGEAGEGSDYGNSLPTGQTTYTVEVFNSPTATKPIDLRSAMTIMTANGLLTEP